MVYWETVTYKEQWKKFNSFSQWKTQNQSLLCQLCGVLSQTICLDNTCLVQLVISAQCPQTHRCLISAPNFSLKCLSVAFNTLPCPLGWTHWIPGCEYVSTSCVHLLHLPPQLTESMSEMPQSKFGNYISMLDIDLFCQLAVLCFRRKPVNLTQGTHIPEWLFIFALALYQQITGRNHGIMKDLSLPIRNSQVPHYVCHLPD